MYFTHDFAFTGCARNDKPVLMGLNFLEHLYAHYSHYLCICVCLFSPKLILTFFCRSFIKLAAKSMRWYAFTIVQDEVKIFSSCLSTFLFYHHDSYRYNTTAPMYGVSLTSGQPVTIVQKFPDLLQQVVFEVCE